MLEVVCVPVIVLLVFGIMEIYKRFIARDKEVLLRIIPLIAGVIGIVLGIVCFYALPDIISASNVWTAILIGGASGLSATGCNQVFKQLTKFGINVTEVKVKGVNDKSEDNANDESN